jgi:4-amino-4-deoxy-L-arabinose transferase-like glycosyltransferase
MAQAATIHLENPVDGATEKRLGEELRPQICPRNWLYQSLLLTLLVLAAILRAWRLRELVPIMIDETIYLRWAEIIQHQHQIFISLLDGKTPLSFWILALTRILFHADPLLSARLLSVACGMASAWLLFVMGTRLAGPVAGFITCGLYTMMPFGLFYDRIAYTEAYVNLAAIALAHVSLLAFRGKQPGIVSGVAVGLTLGVGYLLKSTAGLLVAIPVAIALASHGRAWRVTRKALLVAFLVTLMFPFFCLLMRPEAPLPYGSSVLLHRTSFFTAPIELLHHPFVNIPTNLELLWEYARAYVTVPLALVVIVCILLSVRRRALAMALFASGCVVPIAIQVTVLNWFPSRYVFPHIWPCLLLVGVTAASVFEESHSVRARIAAIVTACVVLVSLVVHTAGFLTRPSQWMQAHDAEEHLGSGPFSGVGVLPAVRFLESQASRGSYVLLTDPIVGPPADAMYPYLNQWSGIRVYDAWWTLLYDSYPILPPEPKLVAKSQYERVPAGVVDFPNLSRVFYVTATNYNSPAQVVARQPSAHLLARFPRPNGKDFIDVYQLR